MPPPPLVFLNGKKPGMMTQREMFYLFVTQIQFHKPHAFKMASFVLNEIQRKVTITDLQELRGGCCAKTVSSESETPSPPGGAPMALGFTSRLCLFLQSASEGRFLLFKTQELRSYRLLTAVNMRLEGGGGGVDNSNHKPSILIDFLVDP